MFFKCYGISKDMKVYKKTSKGLTDCKTSAILLLRLEDMRIFTLYRIANISALSDGKQGVSLSRASVFRAIHPYTKLKEFELKQFKAVKN